MLVHNYFGSLDHCGLILDLKEWNWWTLTFIRTLWHTNLQKGNDLSNLRPWSLHARKRSSPQYHTVVWSKACGNITTECKLWKPLSHAWIVSTAFVAWAVSWLHCLVTCCASWMMTTFPVTTPDHSDMGLTAAQDRSAGTIIDVRYLHESDSPWLGPVSSKLLDSLVCSKQGQQVLRYHTPARHASSALWNLLQPDLVNC